MDRAIARESFCQQPVNVSIHVQAEVPARHFVILSAWINASVPVYDLVGARVNGTEPHAVRRWRRQREGASAPPGPASRRIDSEHAPH